MSALQGKILVVDDDPNQVFLLTCALSERRYAVCTATDGTTAWALTQAEMPDLILLDLALPDVSGLTICDRIKTNEQTWHIPVIFISGSHRLEDKEQAFSVGGVDYITKPFEIEEAVTRVELQLALRNLQRDLERKNAQLEQEIAERRRSEDMLRSLAERLRILHEIDQSILAAHSSDSIALAAVNRIHQLLPCQRAIVIENNDGNIRLLAAESRPPIPPLVDLTEYAHLFNEAVLQAGRVFGAGHLTAQNARSPWQKMLFEQGIRAYVAAPLSVQNELVGVLCLESAHAGTFNVEHVHIATEIATLLAVAIRQVRLYELAQLEIAEREQAERALRQYNIELETRNTELDAFAHTVAHDLKIPLTSLIGFSRLLEQRYDKMSPEQARERLQNIIQTGAKMTNIIDELLLLASVRKMDEVDIAPLDMAGLTGQVRIRLLSMIQEHGAEIREPALWLPARGYAPWIEEVWVNYISNAIKYGGKPPQITLGCTSLRSDMAAWPPTSMPGKPGIVRFWVRDNGQGIAQAEQNKLFNLFTRLGRQTANTDEGTSGHGLGLSIVKRIVEKLGGQVGLSSQPGQGSTFWFTLPGV